MKVKELMEVLKGLDPDTVVVMSSDPEGNSFHEVTAVNPESGWDGDTVGLWELTKQDRDSGYTEEDVVNDRKAVVLWP